MTKYIICDIDGTICDSSHRRPDELDKVKDDKVIKVVADAIMGMSLLYCEMKIEIEIIYITCRSEKDREITLNWLLDNNIYLEETKEEVNNKLFMRDNLDNRPAYEVKRDIFVEELEMGMMDPLTSDEVICVFENDPDCVKMYRKLGLKVFDVGGK